MLTFPQGYVNFLSVSSFSSFCIIWQEFTPDEVVLSSLNLTYGMASDRSIFAYGTKASPMNFSAFFLGSIMAVACLGAILASSSLLLSFITDSVKPLSPIA